METSPLPSSTEALLWIEKKQKEYKEAFLALEKLKQELVKNDTTKTTAKEISIPSFDLHWGC